MVSAATDGDQLLAQFHESTRTGRLGLTILPTEKCDFRCVYCYEDFALPKMSHETIERVKRFLHLRFPGLDTLSIEWFGGEPLLALDAMESVSEPIIDRMMSDGLRYSSGVTTNGWRLTPDVALRLLAIETRRAQVSLDGPKDLHDTTRVRAGGGGSFDRIHSNLRDVRDSGVELQVMLRVHLTPENSAAMPDFIDYLSAEYLGDARFTLLLTRVDHLGGPNDGTFSVLSGAQGTELIGALSRRIGSRAIVGSDRVDVAEAILDGGIDVCYAAKPNALIIRSDGSLAKCTVGLRNPKNRLGMLQEDGTLAIDESIQQLWSEGWFSGDLGALACPLRAIPRIAQEPDAIETRAVLPLRVVTT